MILRQIAYRVQMKSGLLTREILTHNTREVGTLVRDKLGRLFRVLSCEEVEYNGVALTKLYSKEGD